jgi:transcriptional regulator with XRE-family HTH domain
MRDSAYDPPALEPQFWARPEVRHALEHQDIGAIFRLLSKHGISQMRIATAAGLGQNRVSLISRDKQVVTTLTLLARIADGLAMPDHARISLGIAPRQAARRSAVTAGTPGDEAAELLQQISSARYVDTSVIQVLQDETDAIRLLDRRLGAPAVAAKLEAHIAQVQASLRHSLSPQRREHLAQVLADAAALAGWQSIDMGRLPAAWTHFELATAAAREARNDALLAFAAGEQAYVLLDLAQPAHALEKVQAVHAHARDAIPAQLRCWLYAAEAEMAAAARQQDNCRTALDLAAREISRPQGIVLPYLALDTAHLARWRGNCLIQFGDTATIRDLTTALAGMDGTFTRAEAGLRCDLAAALHAAGERHEARQHLKRATELAQLTGSARQRRRITTLAQRIGTAA